MSHERQPDRQPDRQRALELLAQGKTNPEAAEELGVRRETVWKWRQEPDFAAELAELQKSRAQEARQRLDGIAADALSVLGAVMNDTGQPAAVRVKAATALLDRASWCETATVRERIRKALDRELDGLLEVLREALEPDLYRQLVRVATVVTEDGLDLSDPAGVEEAKARVRRRKEAA